MSVFTNYIRGFNENRFWNHYIKSQKGNRLFRLINIAIYMKMASAQGGYIGRETVFQDKPHFPHGLH